MMNRGGGTMFVGKGVELSDMKSPKDARGVPVNSILNTTPGEAVKRVELSGFQ